MDKWIVHKFGGSSVADASCFRRVADIIEASPNPREAVVLSACRGVTDALLGLVALAERPEGYIPSAIEQLKRRHEKLAAELLSRSAYETYCVQLNADCRDIARRPADRAPHPLGDLLDARRHLGLWRDLVDAPVRALPARARAHLGARCCGSMRARSSSSSGGRSGRRCSGARASRTCASWCPPSFKGRLIVTGFVATTIAGMQTTLGRNGSDFSGSIFGALLEASEIIIWTDVDGVLSADPRLVPNAQVIDQLSYNEAMELAYFGAKVIHPQTMEPAVARDIPIYIRNTFSPEKRGTLICANPVSALKVKGITTIDPVALVNLEGAGMIGVPGTAHRLFGALRDAGISVILISQGSSEHSICFAIPAAQAVRAEDAVRRAFDAELRDGQIQHVDVALGLSILAVVGDGMAGAHGVAAKVFNSLGDAAISVRAIAQGASERNISVVVDGKVAAKALRAVHAAFYLSPNTLSIGLIGPGTVGRVLLAQIATQARAACARSTWICACAASRTRSACCWRRTPSISSHWAERLAQAGEPLDLEKFAAHCQADYIPHTVIIDCTASAAVAGTTGRGSPAASTW